LNPNNNAHTQTIDDMIQRFISACCIGLAVLSNATAQEPVQPVEEPAITVVDDPAVRAALALPRTEPIDYVTTIEALSAFGHSELAAPIVDELAALQLDATQRATLVSQVGTARLMKLASNDLLPESIKSFVEQSMAAAAETSTSPERVAQLVSQLSEPGTSKRAVRELARIGTPAVEPVLAVLARDDSPPAARGSARRALLALRPASEPALLAAMETKRPHLKADAAELLAGLRVTQAGGPLAVATLIPTGDEAADARIAAAFEHMAGTYADVATAERLLKRSIENALAGVPVFAPSDGRISMFAWSDEMGTLTPIDLPIADANLVHAARLSRDLALLRGDRIEYRLQAARLTIEANVLLDEANQTPVDLTTLTTYELSRLLLTANDERHFTASLAALKETTSRRDPTALDDWQSQPGPVAQGLRSPSPRVRHAALTAIGAIDSPTAFPGSSYVADSLTHALTAHGRRVAVAAAPRLEEAVTWVGSLASAGYAGEAVTTGRELIDIATSSADVEMIWIDMTIASPGVREVVFQLRREPWTAQIPIVLLAREPQINRARQIAGEHNRVIAQLRPHSEAARLEIAEDLSAMLPRDWPTADERLAVASDAAELARQLLAADRDFYRLRSAIAVRESDIDPLVGGDKSWQTLGLLGTPGSQRTLVELASRAMLFDQQRQQAIDALANSIDAHGVLLSTDEIQRQYDLYNSSLAVGQADVELLSNILDAIEAPRKRAVKGVAE
jgi:hypothetical protein